MRRFYKMCETHTLLDRDNFQAEKIQDFFNRKYGLEKLTKNILSYNPHLLQILRLIYYQMNMSYCRSQSLRLHER